MTGKESKTYSRPLWTDIPWRSKCARGMCEADPDRTRASLVLRRLSLCILFSFSSRPPRYWWLNRQWRWIWVSSHCWLTFLCLTVTTRPLDTASWNKKEVRKVCHKTSEFQRKAMEVKQNWSLTESVPGESLRSTPEQKLLSTDSLTCGVAEERDPVSPWSHRLDRCVAATTPRCTTRESTIVWSRWRGFKLNASGDTTWSVVNVN